VAHPIAVGEMQGKERDSTVCRPGARRGGMGFAKEKERVEEHERDEGRVEREGGIREREWESKRARERESEKMISAHFPKQSAGKVFCFSSPAFKMVLL
jgi:hypothetical protein